MPIDTMQLELTESDGHLHRKGQSEGKERPKGFAAKEGSKDLLVTFKKEKG